MPSVYEQLLGVFAEHARDAQTAKGKIIAERNMLVGACAVAHEKGNPDLSRDIFIRAADRYGVQLSTAIDTSNWSHAVRIVHAAVASNTAGDTDAVLGGLLIGNPYRDISIDSHPAGHGTARQIFS